MNAPSPPLAMTASLVKLHEDAKAAEVRARIGTSAEKTEQK